MANVFDYIDWRDIDISKVEFNEIDAAILARFSYFPLEYLNLENENMTIKDVYKKYKKAEKKGVAIMKNDTKFFPILANSKRFGKLIVSNFVKHIDMKIEKQFCAMVIELPDNSVCVSYEGTDNTLIGWKEDFNMSFQAEVPAQIESVNYLNQIAKLYKNKKIRIVGHSKGGNLAVYAAAFCEKKVRDRIIDVYNFDGPGFQKEVLKTEGYQAIKKKTYRYIPQTSVVGRLLYHEGKTIVMKSSETGIMQHDLYSWQLLGDKFEKTTLTESSEFIDVTLTNWLNEVKPEQRKELIDILFEIISSTGAKTLAELSSKKVETARILLKTYNTVDEQSKEIISKSLSLLFQVAKSNIKIPKPALKPTLTKMQNDRKIFAKK